MIFAEHLHNFGSVGKLVKGVDGDAKMLLDEGDSRQSCDQEGARANITNFPTEPQFLLKSDPETLSVRVVC
jgi:hypothetical protein